MSMGGDLKTKMEEVCSAAAATMENLVLSPHCITLDYMVYRSPALSNTFLNYVDDSQKHSRPRRRCASIASVIPIRDRTIASGSEPPCDEKAVSSAITLSGGEVSEAEAASTPVQAVLCGNLGCSSDAEGAAAKNADATGFTTIMLQNLPLVFKQSDLLVALDSCGWTGTYNYCYVPASFHDSTCRGYAFINFTKPESAACFLSAWQGCRRFCDSHHRKPLIAAIAGLQGLEALLAQPSMKKLRRVKNPAFRPFVARPYSGKLTKQSAALLAK